MRAVCCTGYGGPEVLVCREVPTPVPGKNEVLIKIRAFPVNTPDRRIRGLNVPFPKAQWILKLLLRASFGFFRPRNPILGNYFAGQIEAVGTNVDAARIGEEVFGYSGGRRGAYAEYLCLPTNTVMAPKPANLTFEQSAAIPYGGGNALYFLHRAGGVKAGQSVLIYGASGAIGAAAVQLAKHYGAHVTGVCGGANMPMVKALGADVVIDYAKENFVDGEGCYDLVFDAVGKLSAANCRQKLAPDGTFVTVMSGNSSVHQEDFVLLKKLAEEGKLKPVIGRYYSLEATAAAHECADGEHTNGVVVVTV